MSILQKLKNVDLPLNSDSDKTCKLMTDGQAIFSKSVKIRPLRIEIKNLIFDQFFVNFLWETKLWRIFCATKTLLSKMSPSSYGS